MENPDRLVKAVNLKNESKNKWYASDTAKAPAVRYAHQNTIKFERGPMLLAAVATQDIEETERLIRDGADVNYSNAEGLTPLHQACIDENFDMVKLLVDNGANINACDNEGWTSLHAAASRGIALEIVRYLVIKGGNIAAVNSDGELPIDLAEDDQITEYFNDEFNKNGIDAEEARLFEEKRMMADAERWKKLGKIDDIRDIQGATPLHVAAAKNYPKVAKILLGLGADPNAKDNEGWTPLHAAVYWKSDEIITELVKAGGKIYFPNNEGQTPFSLAEKDIKPLIQNLAQKYNQKQEPEVLKKVSPNKDLKVTGILKTSKPESALSDGTSSKSTIQRPVQKPPSSIPTPKIPMPSRQKDESAAPTSTPSKSTEIEKPPTKSAITPPARPGASSIARPSRPQPDEEIDKKPDVEPKKESLADIPKPSTSSIAKPPTSIAKPPTPSSVGISKPPTPSTTGISKPPTSTTSSIPKPSTPSTTSSIPKPSTPSTTSSISKPPTSTSSIAKPPTSTSSIAKPPTSEIPKPGISRPPHTSDASSESESNTELRDLKTRILLLEGEVSSLKKERENLLKIIDNLRAENEKNDTVKKTINTSSSIARPPTKK